MEFTGERYVPQIQGQIRYEHIHRYALATEYVIGKSVLDIASGEGYGSAMLAKVAYSVVGVDIDPESVEYAEKHYSHDYQNLKFIVGSCDSVPLPEQSIEVVTSFETIEHHDKHEEMMLEIKRVLKPGGVLIISSPNRLTYSDEPKYCNPFHVKELYYEELVTLLSQHFKYVQIYGQKLAVGSFTFPLQSSTASSIKAYTGDVKHVFQRVSSLESPIYFIAICSDESRITEESINSVYIDSADDPLKELQAELARAQTQQQHTQAELAQAQTQQQHTQAELAQAQTQQQHTQAELAQVQMQQQHTQAELAQVQMQQQRTQAELAQVQMQQQHTQAELAQAQTQQQHTQAELAQAQCKISVIESSKFWKLRMAWFRVKRITWRMENKD